MKKIAVILTAILFLAACATAEVGQKFNTSEASKIEIGKTTEAQVLASLGQPPRVQTTATGEKTFYYVHSEAKATLMGVNAKAEKLTVNFGKNGIVKALDKTGID